MSKLWGGAFDKPTAKEVEVFTASIALDERLWKVDIQGSIAHARMLGQSGVITQDESNQIISGLHAVESDIENGNLGFDGHAEDVHSEIEKFLRDKIGPIAGKLHTARSRNDQVVTDTRLYLRAEIQKLKNEIKSIQSWIVTKASENKQTVLSGMTHLQHAQPISLAHHILAYFWMLARDSDRLSDLEKRLNIMPLGSAALAGTTFSIDRNQTASELGFSKPSENSLDAVSDRDFIIEFLSASSLIMMHLSRWCEELIIWSTPEFGYVKLDDSVTTGSSIMPQKKNPDVAELIRGKTGRLYGALMGALTMMKALPLSYNRDLQEDKTFLFEGVDTTLSSLRLMRLMLETAHFIPQKMREHLKNDFSNATEIADDLVQKGLPFRDAHEISGRVVKYCVESKIGIEDLTLQQLKAISNLFDENTLSKLNHDSAMSNRNSIGGTGVKAVEFQIKQAQSLLNKNA